MVVGDELKIGKIAPNMDSYTDGMPGVGNSSLSQVTLPNSDYNQTRVSQSTQSDRVPGNFLSLTLSNRLNAIYSDANMVGVNPLSPEEITKQQYAAKGAGANLYGLG